MKNIITTTILISSMLFSQYLQDGIYPECSYVIVDQEGWKIHKNQDGKTISMTRKHNEKPGKYSFDKFGNLVPFKECVKDNNLDLDDNIEVDIDIEISLFENMKFSVYGGMSMPFGDNIDNYEIAPMVGLDVNFNKLNISINTSSFEYEQEITGQDDVVYYRKNSLSSMNIFLGYTINYKNLYITPSIGMLSRTNEVTGAGLTNVELTGSDLAFQTEVGYNFGKFSMYGSGNLSTTLYGSEQTATFYNFGLKYNF